MRKLAELSSDEEIERFVTEMAERGELMKGEQEMPRDEE
jgi:hypothetical protein